MTHKLLAALAASLLLSYPVAHAQDKNASAAPEAAPAAAPMVAPTITVDKTSLANGGVFIVSGQGTPGKPVFLEVFNENKVRGSHFDKTPNKETGKIPYKLYLADEIPAFYRIYVPTTAQPILDKFKKEGRKWSYSAALKETGGNNVYNEPGKRAIIAYQASLAASIVGSRGELLPALDDKERVSRSMQIIKSRFRSVDRTIVATVDQKDDGSFTAKVTIPQGAAPGKFVITAGHDKKALSQPVMVENSIAFPMRYMSNAGTSLNIFIPFLIVLGLATFGVLMGAGGGFIINPVLLMMFPLPHTIVAGTVTPTVLFSQASGVINYSKIDFISWKVGVTLGVAMLAGGFIGPVLTSMVTVDEFKFVFGWILFILAALMFWQTTPGYISKNKKEQSILKEFQKRAAEAAAAKAAKA
jgi:hypothetical protein